MFQVSIHRKFKYQVKGIDESLSTDTTELSSMNVKYKKQRRSKLDQFHGQSRENWQKQLQKKSRNMADAGNEDRQCQKLEEEHQEDKTRDEDTAAPTEMYLPDLDNTPLSQALKNGLDWGMEDEVMVECPKLKQYFSIDTLLIQIISGRVHLHTKEEDETFPISCSKTKFPIPLLKKALEGAEQQRAPPMVYQEKTGHGKSRPSYIEWN